MKKIMSLVVVCLFLACNTPRNVVSTPAGISFVNSDKLRPVLEMAVEKEKLVFVDFYTTWCLPCKLMEEDVFSDQKIYEFFNDNFINFKVDAEKGNGPNLAMIYGVQVYPTLLFLDENGEVLVRKEGAAYHTELRALAESALARQTTGE